MISLEDLALYIAEKPATGTDELTDIVNIFKNPTRLPDEILSTVASNPKASVNTLKHLVATDDDTTISQVISNPAYPLDKATRLVKQKPHLLRYLAFRPDLPSQTLNKIVNKISEDSLYVKVVDNPALTSSTLSRMATKTENMKVRKGIASHPNTPPAALTFMWKQANSRNMGYSEIAAELMINPNFGIEHLMAQYKKGKIEPEVFQIIPNGKTRLCQYLDENGYTGTTDAMPWTWINEILEIIKTEDKASD